MVFSEFKQKESQVAKLFGAST